jgi:predicted permease
MNAVRIALRRLLKAPGFALTVVLTLALGIGATTAIFSIIEGVLLRPLPFRDAGRLVELGDHLGNGPGIAVTPREIATYASATTAFAGVGGYIQASYELSGNANPEQVSAARVTAGVFPVLEVQPVLGRVFTHEEEAASQQVAVLSYRMWLERFHRDPAVLGKAIELDRRTYTILGVMPREFAFPLQRGRLDQVQLWAPLSLTAAELSPEHAGVWGYHLVARLKDGVEVSQAAQDADRVSQQIMRDFPVSMAAIKIRGDVKPLLEASVADARSTLRTLFAAVAVVLLIACANVAGLMLMRAIRGRREYAVRLALGARSGTILRESVVEGLLLSLVGGLLGLGLAAVAVRVAVRFLPESMPRIDSIAIDLNVVVFALVVAAGTGAVCSLVPAFAAMRTNLRESLNESARGGTGAASHAWLRSTLVVAEIAVALVLLTVSVALLRSFQKMRDVDPGFRVDHVMVAGFQLPLRQYATADSADVFRRAVLEKLEGKPGVIASGIARVLPGSGAWAGSAYTIEGVPVASWKLQFADFTSVEGDYFGAIGIPLLEGRLFNADDRPGGSLVVIVNQAMARHCWPGQSPVGKRMHSGNPKKGYPWATVVGVVGNTKVGARDEPDADQWYIPARQPEILFGADASQTLTRAEGGYVTLRTALAPETMAGVVRGAIAEVDPQLAVLEMQPMAEVVASSEAPRRFNTDLVTAFAAGALLLALIGMYAVVAFSTSLRAQEIAIRMALGAPRGRIARMVLASGARLALVGCGLGLAGLFAVASVVRSFLFEVSATDPWIYSGAALSMMLLATVACLLPALRAASVDPIGALRAM